METIVIKPKTEAERKAVLDFLGKLNIEAEMFPAKTKKEILDGIEQGAKEAAEYLRGKRKLRSVKGFLNEL